MALRVRMMRRGVLGTQEVTVVGVPLRGRAEDRVGFGDLHEAGGGVRIVRIAVWMVGFGECVEGSG